MCTSLKTTREHKDSVSAARDKKVAREVLLNLVNKLTKETSSLKCTSVRKKLVVNL